MANQKYCRNCGASNLPTDMFCTNCGSAFVSAPASPSLVFSFLQLILIIVRPFDVTIPVPRGQEERGREIVRALGGSSE